MRKGVPDDTAAQEIRARCWMIMLGYLPKDTSEWKVILKKQRALYAAYVQELNVKPDDVELSTQGFST